MDVPLLKSDRTTRRGHPSGPQEVAVQAELQGPRMQPRVPRKKAGGPRGLGGGQLEGVSLIDVRPLEDPPGLVDDVDRLREDRDHTVPYQPTHLGNEPSAV